MGFQKVPFETLCKNIQRDIELLIGHHSASSIQQLDRRYEVELLLKTIDVLNAPLAGRKSMTEGKKTLLLNAMTLYVRECINESYKLLSNKSFLHTRLGFSLGLCDISTGIIENNQPTLEDRKIMFKALHAFMLLKIYVHSDSSQGYLPESEQPFLSVKGFNSVGFIKKLATEVAKIEKESVTLCEKKAAEELSAGKGYSGMLGGIFGGAAKKPDDDFSAPGFQY